MELGAFWCKLVDGGLRRLEESVAVAQAPSWLFTHGEGNLQVRHSHLSQALHRLKHTYSDTLYKAQHLDEN